MDIQEIKETLQNKFDSVGVMQDGSYIARRAYPYPNRIAAVRDMRRRLDDVFPNAHVYNCGDLKDGRTRATISWFIEFGFE